MSEAVLTKAEQVERLLRNAIREGRWSAGEALPPERDLLIEFSVSRATLRNAMFSLARDGLVVRKHGSGTYVAESCKAGTVAILAEAQDLASPLGCYYRSLVQKLQECIEECGWRPVLSVGEGKTTEEFMSSIHLMDEPIIKDTIGVINLADRDGLEDRLTKAGVHSVNIVPGVSTGKYSVRLDYPHLIRLGVEVLVSHGYNDFALMFTDFGQVLRAKWDEETFQHQMEVHRGAVGYREDRLVTFAHSPGLDGAYDAFKEWWLRSDRPSAIMFTDAPVFDVASRAILELGIKVPDELAIVTHSVDDRQFHSPVPMAHIVFDAGEVAIAGWQMLRKLITGQPVDQPSVKIEPYLAEGKSLG